MWIGVAGLVLLGIGWMFETLKLIKEKKSRIDVKFGVLYVVGSLCLVIYSLQIRDVVFLVLNGIIMTASSIALYYTIRKG